VPGAFHGSHAPAYSTGLTPFEAVSLEGGGEVVIRPGTRHGVRVLRGDPRALEITSVWRRGLRIRCRPNACRNFTPRVEVTAPRVTALAVHGGGSLHVERGFAPQSDLAVSVHGGGHVDTTQVSASNVAASVMGGGKIETHARSSLAASVHGGGLVHYHGAPQVATSIHGGGAVEPIGGGRRRR
jgi:hypothetical protein